MSWRPNSAIRAARTTSDDPEQIAEILEDRDEYIAENVFWVPEEARWAKLLAAASQPDIAKRIDDALDGDRAREPRPAERAPARLRPRAAVGRADGVARRDDREDRVRHRRQRERATSSGGPTSTSSRSSPAAEGHRGGEFFTPAPVARLLVEMLEPYEGRVLDPACGSCGLFVQSARFIEAHGGRPEKISIYGQERNQATWRIGRMNLAIHGLSGEIRYTQGGSLLDDAFPTLKADFVMANPPFNLSEWSTPAIARRRALGVRRAAHRQRELRLDPALPLPPRARRARRVRDGERVADHHDERRGQDPREPRRADVVDCIVALPAQLFYTTGIPVCLWFLDRNKASNGERDRRGETLFIDARQMGRKISRTQIELTDEEIERDRVLLPPLARHRGVGVRGRAGLLQSASLAEIEAAGFTLSPGRYVGAPESEEDEIAFEERMATLVDRLAEEMAENERLADEVKEALARVGYEV